MINLAALKFCNEVRPTPAFRSSPMEKMRATILNGIANQRILVAQERGENVRLTKTIRVATDSGATEEKTVARKPAKWFWATAKGNVVMEMTYSRIAVAVGGPGKTVIDCGDLNGVGVVLDVLAEAVDKGELDKALMAAAEAAKAKTMAKKAV
jgi:hypothetical protein